MPLQAVRRHTPMLCTAVLRVRHSFGWWKPEGCTVGRRSLPRVAATVAAVLLATAHARAWAQDKPPHLLLEPTDFTDVIDAFERDDPLDVNVNLSFTRSRHTATIAREHSLASDRAAGHFLPIAQSEQITNALALELDVGVYRDLMVYGRLPLVLSDTRELHLPDAASCDTAECTARRTQVDEALAGSSALPGDGSLFDLSPGYKAATRSGVPAVDFGVAWGIVNQFRTPYLPTWVVSVEARIGVGRVMTPCTDRGDCQTGINRGTARLEFASRWSRRFRYLEPYFGISYAFEWATGASQRFSPGGAVPGYLDTAPPSVLGSTLGAAVIVWEERGRFQRVAIDVRTHAAYVSAGRDYTPLFDALGTSQNQHLSLPYQSASGDAVPFRGLTNVDSYARLRLEIAASIQAARYVRFRLGVSLAKLTSHLLTDAAPCSAVSVDTCPTDQVNPLYRPVIDIPGQRFRMSGDLDLAMFANAVGQF